MQNFNTFINKNIEKPNVNEFVGLLLAGGLLAWGFAPLLSKAFSKKEDDKGGGLFGWFTNRKDRKLDKKEKELDRRERELKLKLREKDLDKKEKELNGEKDDDKSEASVRKSALTSLLLAKQLNSEEKDDDVKKENEQLMNSLSSCLYDKDGNEVPLDKIEDALKKSLPAGTSIEDLSKLMGDDYKKVANNPKAIEEIEDKESKVSEKDLKSFEDETKEAVKNTTEKESDDNDSKEDNTPSKEDIENEYKEKDAALDKEYQDKIDKEEDKDKKKELEDEWVTKSDELDKEKKEALNKVKDNTEEKDKDGNILKHEEITDPDTGEKKKVVTHTGPRGGKFYYPEGKPKTADHKVYVSESKCINTKNIPLRLYLHKVFR